jgi:hypothetical protein
MFDALKKLFAGKNTASPGKRPAIEKCPDCQAESGELHDLFCTKERCPFCGGQLMSCDCIGTVLNLSPIEQQAVDESFDDSAPPLSEIMERWRGTLAAKGRIPFEAYPDDPIRAAHRGDIAALKVFLANGFLPNTGNEAGYTCLMGAARGGCLEAIRFLLSNGAKVTQSDNRGYTALHWAVAQPDGMPERQIASIRALLGAGADLNAKGLEGGTPLMEAAWFGCRDSVKELILRGANPHLRDDKGRSAGDLASLRGHRALLELLN